jgi:epoxyqueuosine reductase
MNLSIEKNTHLIKALAMEAGFGYCGISKSEFLEEDATRLDHWLSNNYHGRMGWMENHYDKRLNPNLLVPGAKSVISLMLNYYTSQKQTDPLAPKISKYAYGEDYHKVIKDKLYAMLLKMKASIGDFEARVFVDSAPVLERSWAAKSGLGWIGKNNMLINKNSGSFYFLAQIICDLELLNDAPIKDYCGTCTACIDACPTEAILPNNVIDSNKCISYLTIELRDEIPVEFKNNMDNWAFGCDICQDVCPWNRFSSEHSEPLFKPLNQFLDLKKEAWEELTSEDFDQLFQNSAIQRTKYKGLLRNITFLK